MTFILAIPNVFSYEYLKYFHDLLERFLLFLVGVHYFEEEGELLVYPYLKVLHYNVVHLLLFLHVFVDLYLLHFLQQSQDIDDLGERIGECRTYEEPINSLVLDLFPIPMKFYAQASISLRYKISHSHLIGDIHVIQSKASKFLSSGLYSKNWLLNVSLHCVVAFADEIVHYNRDFVNGPL